MKKNKYILYVMATLVMGFISCDFDELPPDKI